MNHRITLAAAVVLLLGAAGFADRETAQFHQARADKALAAKKWDEAESLYRKALDEDETFLPARWGAAQALVGAGKSAAAVEELRAFVDGARAAENLPADWKTLLTKAEKQLSDLDASTAALQKLADTYADDLVSLAEKWESKDTELAEKSLRRALLVKPGHAKATKALEKMGKSSAGEAESLFNGKNFTGWDAANQPEWQALGGMIVGEANDATYYTRTLRHLEGDFDVRCEMRQVSGETSGTVFGILPCWKGAYDYYYVGPSFGRLVFMERTDSSGKVRDVAVKNTTDFSPKFDPHAWNLYEIRCRGDEASAYINGTLLGTTPRPESRKSGFVGLIIQNVKIEIRRLEVETR